MSALKFDQMQPGTTVYFVDTAGSVQSGNVIAVKRRGVGKPQICIDTPPEIILRDFYEERFFPAEQEAWYAAAMFAQRAAKKAMADADTAFQKAGIALPQPAAA